MRLLASCAAALLTGSLSAHPLTIADLSQRERVADPQLSPDGASVLYTVSSNEQTSVWQVNWNGGTPRRLTDELESATSPRWSPDGRWISYLKSVSSEEGAQVWLLDRRSGATRPVTSRSGGDVIAYFWAPDSNRLALVWLPRSSRNHAPLVVNRYRFKSDEAGGYLHEGWIPPRIYLQDLRTGASDELTDAGGFEETDPSWSPDGGRIAFVSNRELDRDRTARTDIYVVESRPHASPRLFSDTNRTNTGPLSWNPRGTEIAFLQSGLAEYGPFEQFQLATVSAAGGPTRSLTDALDRDIGDAAFATRDSSLCFIVFDNRKRYLARLTRPGGRVQAVAQIPGKILSFAQSRGRTVVLATFDTLPAEVYALEKGSLRQLTHHNDSWAHRVDWAAVEEIEFSSTDGQVVSGLLTLPLGYRAGQRYPTILWIHGGPHLQDEHGFTDHSSYDPRQLFAANGYAVLQVNYRGSHGRGTAFGRGAFGDWGNQDVADLLAGVDYVIGKGIADPRRLGVGGWSFGGFLTDYLIVSTPRFAAAISGAGSGSKLSLYGSDSHTSSNEREFGTPWDHPDVWLRISRPLFEAKKVETPTLFVGGELDFNVPIAGSEQMYQALKSRQVPTQLVIYPGEHHMIEQPAFERDLLQRYLDWYAQYLRGGE